MFELVKVPASDLTEKLSNFKEKVTNFTSRKNILYYLAPEIALVRSEKIAKSSLQDHIVISIKEKYNDMLVLKEVEYDLMIVIVPARIGQIFELLIYIVYSIPYNEEVMQCYHSLMTIDDSTESLKIEGYNSETGIKIEFVDSADNILKIKFGYKITNPINVQIEQNSKDFILNKNDCTTVDNSSEYFEKIIKIDLPSFFSKTLFRQT